MKTPSSELFQLIQSLTWQERRFIKSRFSSAETISEQLFTYLCKIREYNERDVLSKFPFLKKNTIKHNKQVLFDFVLQKLEAYHSENHEEQKIHKILYQVQILRKRKIFNKARQLLGYAISKARLHNFFLLQVQLQIEQEKLALFSNDVDYFDAAKKINDDTSLPLLHHYNLKRILEQHRNDISATEFRKKTTQALQKSIQIQTIYKSVCDHEKNGSFHLLPESIRLEIQFLKYYCLLLTGDYKHASLFFMVFLKNYEKSTFAGDEEKHMQHIVNGIGIAAFLKDDLLLYKLNKKADQLFQSTLKKRRTGELKYHYSGVKVNLIGFLIAKHQFTKAKSLSEELKKDLFDDIQGKSIFASIKKLFLINLCEVYLFCDEPKNALHEYHELVNDSKLKTVRVDLNCYSNVVGLIIYYELNMESNLESLARSCARDPTFASLPNIYKLVIRFFNHLLNGKDFRQRLDLFRSMLKQVNSVKNNDKPSLAVLANIEIQYWLTRKISQMIVPRGIG